MIIDIGSEKLTLTHEQGEWSSEIIGQNSATHSRHSFTLIQDEKKEFKTRTQGSIHPEEEWNKKLKEIYSFQVTNGKEVTEEQKEQLVEVYNKYRNTFSDLPGKAKNFVCELEFHNSIKFNTKSYPIAQLLKRQSGKKYRRC